MLYTDGRLQARRHGEPQRLESGGAGHDRHAQRKHGRHAELGTRVVREDAEDARRHEPEQADAEADKRKAVQGAPEPARGKAPEHEEIEADEEGVPNEQDDRQKRGREASKPDVDDLAVGKGVQGQDQRPQGAEDLRARHDRVGGQESAEREDKAAHAIPQGQGEPRDVDAQRLRGRLDGLALAGHRRPWDGQRLFLKASDQMNARRVHLDGREARIERGHFGRRDGFLARRHHQQA